MALTFIATAEYNNSSSNSAVVNKPTGTTDGDIMFAFVATAGSQYTNSQPANWNFLGQTEVIAGTHRTELWYRVASSEGADYTWGVATASNFRVLNITYRGGFDTADPIDVVSNTPYLVSNDIARAASMTVSAANSALLFFGIIRATSARTFTKPIVPTTDWAEDYDNGSTAPDFWNEVCSMTWTSSGATGDIDATMSAASTAKHAFAVALNPPASVKKLAALGVG